MFGCDSRKVWMVVMLVFVGVVVMDMLMVLCNRLVVF